MGILTLLGDASSNNQAKLLDIVVFCLVIETSLLIFNYHNRRQIKIIFKIITKQL